MLSVAAAPPSANSEARAPRPWGRERRRRRAGVVRRPQTVANFAASPELARARLIPYKPDQIQSPPRRPPSQPESWRLRPPKCCGCRQPLPTSGGPTGKLSVAGAGGGAAVGVRVGGGGLEEPETPAARCSRRRSLPTLFAPPSFPSPWRGSKGLSRPRATASAAPSSRRDRQPRCSAPARSRRGHRSRGCATGARPASRRHWLLPRRPHPCPSPTPLRASLPPSQPGPRPGGGVCGARGERGKGPCLGEGAGAGCSSVSSRLRRATRAEGEHLSHPPGAPRKVFFSPPSLCPSPTPTLRPAGVGLGPLVKKVTRSHQLLLPPGDRVAGCGGAGGKGGRRRGGPGRTSGLAGGGASRGGGGGGLQRSRVPAEGCPHQSRLRAGQRQHPTCFIPACSATASERARRGEGVCLQTAAPWCSEAAAPAPTLIHFAG